MMNRVLVVLLLLLPALGQSQSKNDIFNRSVPLVFFGSDFSNVRFTRSDEFTNKDQILRYFVDINNIKKKLLQPGPYRNQWENWLNRDSIECDFSYVTEVNAGVDWQKVYSDDIEYRISEEEMGGMIKRLGINQVKYKDYIGFVYIEENYCKTKPLGTLSLVFFNVNDLQPLLIKEYSSRPVGAGFLNYWGYVDTYAHVMFKAIKKELK
jgi:hypothetical protein